MPKVRRLIQNLVFNITASLIFIINGFVIGDSFIVHLPFPYTQRPFLLVAIVTETMM